MRTIHLFIIPLVIAVLTHCARKPGEDLQCPGKSFSIGEHRYCAHGEYATWHEAWKRCADAGGYLAVINSEEENEAIWELLGSKWEHSLWIGFSDSEGSPRGTATGDRGFRTTTDHEAMARIAPNGSPPTEDGTTSPVTPKPRISAKASRAESGISDARGNFFPSGISNTARTWYGWTGTAPGKTAR